MKAAPRPWSVFRYRRAVKPIINVDDVAFVHHTHGERFEARDGSASNAIGCKLLGCSVIVVPPGKRAWPFHNHHINEELFVILAGTGTVRIGTAEYPVKQGDIIAAPPGGPETAHQIVNTSDGELRYLAISTMIPSEVVEYPDSGKLMVLVGAAPGGTGDRAAVTYYRRGRPGPEAEYWDGE